MTGSRHPGGAGRPRALLALVVGGLVALASGVDLLHRWELDVFDRLSRAAVRPDERSPDVAIILLDEASLDWGRDLFERAGEPGRPYLFPWQRSVYDTIAWFLAAGGAEVLALDVELSGPHPAGDGADEEGLGMTTSFLVDEGGPLLVQSLNLETSERARAEVRTLEPATRAAVEAAAVEVPGWREEGLPFDRSDEGPYSNPILPHPAILRGLDEPDDLRLGAVTVQPDDDAVIRRARLLVAWDGLVFPSLGLAAALARLEQRHPPVSLAADADALVVTAADGERRLPLTPSGDLLVRWRDDGREAADAEPGELAGRFPVYPAHRVLRSALRAMDPDGALETLWNEPPPGPGYFLEPTEFAGRLVFVGANAAGLRDLKATPVEEDYPGVKVHAAVAEAVLAGEGVRRAPAGARAAAAALVAALTCWLAGRRGGHLARIVSVLVLAGLVAAAGAVAFVQAGSWWNVVTPLAGVALAYASATTLEYFTEGRRSRRISGLFEHFAPGEVVRRLIDRPGDLLLEGETREITVFFSDIRGFTTLAGTRRMQQDPALLTRHLNAYLTEMTAAITACGGTVDKYIGDAVVALFGAPLPLEDHAAAACRAALLCQERLRDFDARAEAAGLPPFPTRIGLDTGLATLGCVGSEQRLSYTAIGATVNLASRLEGVNKVYGTSVVAGRHTVEAAGDAVRARLLDRVRVPGVNDEDPPLEVHEILGPDKGPDEGPDAELDAAYEAARRVYEEGRFEAAAVGFEPLAAAGDPPSRVLYDRCREFSRSPPPEGWDGVHRIEGK